MDTCNTALLLSAGIGSRLKNYLIETPKCLGKIDEEKTILDYQIESLSLSKIANIYIVTGYCHDKVEDYIKKKYSKFNINIIYNPFYNISNNIGSLWLAFQIIKPPLITINGDNIFSTDIITGLIQKTDDIVLTYSQKENYDEDDMKIIFENDYLLTIGKDLPADKANGESVGMIKYTANGYYLMNKVLNSMFQENSESLKLFYLSAIKKIAERSQNVKLFKVDKNKWREFDFPEDFMRYESELKGGKISIK